MTSCGVAIFYNNKILICHPTGANKIGAYSIPKGKQEEGETYLQTALRELREETGLTIDKSLIDDKFKKSLRFFNHICGCTHNPRKIAYFTLSITDLNQIGLKRTVVPKTQLQLEEIDWAGFVDISKAKELMDESQHVILDYKGIIYANGGWVYGPSHADGGVKFTVQSTGQRVELEGKEPVIVDEAMESNKTHKLIGKPAEIVDALNKMYADDYKEGQPVKKLVGGESIINKINANAKEVLQVEGTPKEIASCINEIDGNGVKFREGDSPCKIKVVEKDKMQEGGELNKEQKLQAFYEEFLRHAQEKNSWMIKSAELFKNFDVKKDTLIKTQYDDLGGYLKRMIPGKPDLLDNEHFAKYRQEHPRLTNEAKVWDELYYLHVDVLSRWPGYIKRIDALLKANPIYDKNLIDWIAGYRQKLVDFAPVAEKYVAMKDRIVKRELKSVGEAKRHEQIKGSLNEDIKRELEAIAEGFRGEIEKNFKGYYNRMVEYYKEKVLETGENSPSGIYNKRKGGIDISTVYIWQDLLESKGTYREVKWLVPENIEEKINRKAKADSEAVIQSFVYKMTDKLGGLLQSINKKVKVTKDRGTIDENSIRFDFEDGSGFTVNNNIVGSHSVHGTPFYRYPTTFHNVILPNGKKLNMPSEIKVKKEFNTLNKLVEGGDLDDSEKNTNFKKIKHEINNIISGKKSIREDALIQAALIYLRGNERTGSQGTRTSSENTGTISESEEERLKEFVGKNNLWYTQKLDDKNSFASGMEQIVYKDQDSGKFVIKINNLINYYSYREYLINLLLHNYFFDDTPYELIGFKLTDRGKFLPVVKQPFVESNQPTDLKQVENFLQDKGFVKPDAVLNIYKNKELGITIGDLHGANVLTKDDVLYFIDTQFFITTDNMKKGGLLDMLNKEYSAKDLFRDKMYAEGGGTKKSNSFKERAKKQYNKFFDEPQGWGFTEEAAAQYEQLEREAHERKMQRRQQNEQSGDLSTKGLIKQVVLARVGMNK